MGIKERRERERTQRRKDIVDAAEKVFFSKGFDKATMDEVAEIAELSKGTLYLYFKSKEDLYLGIIRRGTAVLGGLFEEAVASQETGIEKVEAVGRAYYKFFREFPDYFNASLYFEQYEINLDDETNPLAVECCKQHDRVFEFVIEALECGRQDGSIRKDVDAEKVAYVLWGQCTGMMQIASAKGEHLKSHHNIDVEGLIQVCFELIRRSLEN